ncbi:MAG: hypothetical protein RR177_06160 [Oscillospiraceae bacterium]
MNRGEEMARGSMNFVKGVGAGMAAGAVMAVVGSTMIKKKKSFSKTTGKAVRVVGDIMDNIQTMMK